MYQVEIRVKGHLDAQWAQWLDDLAITCLETDETNLSGMLADQSALYGLVARLRDLGLELVSVNFQEQISEESGAADNGYG